MLKAGIIGFGAISRAHRKAYLELEQLGKVKLICACDVEPQAFDRTVTINIDASQNTLEEHINHYTDLYEMLAKEKLDLVDLCVPTYLHKKLAVELLRKGYHVLCEKPMALSYADCKEMLCAAKESGKELMIGQCLRFYSAFDRIKGMMEEECFGAVLGGHFSRLSPLPTWGWNNWFADPTLSGGGITDFHIHDVDIIRYLFGEPTAVSSRGSSSFSVYDTVHTSLFYGDVPITAIADWTHVGMPFEASCYINFEKATVRYDGTVLAVYYKEDGREETLPLDPHSGYFGEIAYFCDVVAGKHQNTKNPAHSAARSIELIEHIRRSADAAGAVIPFLPTDPVF